MCFDRKSRGEGWELHGYLGQPWSKGWSNTSDNEEAEMKR